jgi:hypothetical protein
MPPISHAANLNKRSKTEYIGKRTNLKHKMNKKMTFSNLLYWQELIANTVFLLYKRNTKIMKFLLLSVVSGILLYIE